MKIRAIRGATTVASDDKTEITKSVVELLSEIFSSNGLNQSDLISILFTPPPDLPSHLPATAARELGLSDTPLICATELDIKDGLPRCIRVLVSAYSNLEKAEIKHIYLRDAVMLRKDIS